MSSKRSRIATIVLTAALALSLTPAAPAMAASKSYGIGSSTAVRTQALFNAGNQKLDGMKAFKYKGKKYNCYDVQAMAIDWVNQRYYITRTGSSGKRAFVFSAPLNATKGTQWTCVGMYTGGWLKHANNMCAIPYGTGTKLLICTNSSKLRCIYIPDATKPAQNVQKSTWVCGSFDGWDCQPRGISYDASTNMLIARNGISYNGSEIYMKGFVFKMPSNTNGSTVKITEFKARFKMEIPKSVTATPKTLAKKAKKAKVCNWSRQDMCYDGATLYNPVSNTSGGKYRGMVASNAILSWNVGDVASIVKKYKKNGKEPCWYSMTKAYFDESVKWNKQGYEIEGIEAANGYIYIATNEGYNGKFDKIRRFTAV